MCPNGIKSDLYINGGGGGGGLGSGRRWGADQIGISIVNTLSWFPCDIEFVERKETFHRWFVFKYKSIFTSNNIFLSFIFF